MPWKAILKGTVMGIYANSSKALAENKALIKD